MTQKIALIECDTAFSSTLRANLEALGYAVLEIPEANRAIDLLKADPPNLIYLSVETSAGPRDGYAICGRIRRTAQLKEIPLVLGATDTSGFEQHMTLKSRADVYLAKPFEVDALVGALPSSVLDVPLSDPNGSDEGAFSFPILENVANVDETTSLEREPADIPFCGGDALPDIELDSLKVPNTDDQGQFEGTADAATANEFDESKEPSAAPCAELTLEPLETADDESMPLGEPSPVESVTSSETQKVAEVPSSPDALEDASEEAGIAVATPEIAEEAVQEAVAEMDAVSEAEAVIEGEVVLEAEVADEKGEEEVVPEAEIVVEPIAESEEVLEEAVAEAEEVVTEDDDDVADEITEDQVQACVPAEIIFFPEPDEDEDDDDNDGEDATSDIGENSIDEIQEEDPSSKGEDHDLEPAETQEISAPEMSSGSEEAVGEVESAPVTSECAEDMTEKNETEAPSGDAIVLAAQLRALRSELETLRANHEEQSAEADGAKVEACAAKAAREMLEHDLAEAKAALETCRAQLDAERAKTSEAPPTNETDNSTELSALRATLDSQAEELASLRAELLGALEREESTQAEATREQELRGEIEKKYAALLAEKADLEAAKTAWESEKAAMEAEKASMESEKADLEQQLSMSEERSANTFRRALRNEGLRAKAQKALDITLGLLTKMAMEDDDVDEAQSTDASEKAISPKADVSEELAEKEVEEENIPEVAPETANEMATSSDESASSVPEADL